MIMGKGKMLFVVLLFNFGFNWKELINWFLFFLNNNFDRFRKSGIILKVYLSRVERKLEEAKLSSSWECCKFRFRI